MDKARFYGQADPNSGGPLAGVRVLEATNYASGPVCGIVLSDLGADSIKCEMPGKGDPNRQVPPFVSDRGDLESSAVFSSINRGKRGITLDLRQAEGQALFRRLAATVDIVIENFTPGTMAAWHVGYEDIRTVKPDIIYVSISGFGQFGPLHHRKGFDPIGQAMGGLMSVTGEPDGRPLRAGTVIADDMAGWQAAIGALAALHHRERTGEGQWVDACLTDAQLYASSYGLMGAANANFVWKRMGNALAGGAPMNTYLTLEGEWFYVFAPVDNQWRALCGVMGREDLLEDPRCNDWPARARNSAFVDQVVAEWVAGLTVEQAQQAVDGAGVVGTPILGYDQILQVEHFRQRESVTEVAHPLNGPLTHFGVADKFSRTPARIRSAAPLLGEHNEAVYRDELGLDEATYTRLREAGVI